MLLLLSHYLCWGVGLVRALGVPQISLVHDPPSGRLTRHLQHLHGKQNSFWSTCCGCKIYVTKMFQTTLIDLRAVEERFCQELGQHAERHRNRFNDHARDDLLEILFRALCGYSKTWESALFPKGLPTSKPWKLSEAQGAVNGSEYTNSARGTACGHIFRANEALYRCK